jgi:hypothetical protein
MQRRRCDEERRRGDGRRIDEDELCLEMKEKFASAHFLVADRGLAEIV